MKARLILLAPIVWALALALSGCDADPAEQPAEDPVETSTGEPEPEPEPEPEAMEWSGDTILVRELVLPANGVDTCDTACGLSACAEGSADGESVGCFAPIAGATCTCVDSDMGVSNFAASDCHTGVPGSSSAAGDPPQWSGDMVDYCDGYGFAFAGTVQSTDAGCPDFTGEWTLDESDDLPAGAFVVLCAM